MLFIKLTRFLIMYKKYHTIEMYRTNLIIFPIYNSDKRVNKIKEFFFANRFRNIIVTPGI
jgi:hypothetical protein